MAIALGKAYVSLVQGRNSKFRKISAQFHFRQIWLSISIERVYAYVSNSPSNALSRYRAVVT